MLMRVGLVLGANLSGKDLFCTERCRQSFIRNGEAKNAD